MTTTWPSEAWGLDHTWQLQNPTLERENNPRIQSNHVLFQGIPNESVLLGLFIRHVFLVTLW